MKITGQKSLRILKYGAAALVLVAAGRMLWPILSPLAARVALVSAVFAMPEGSISALADQFRALTPTSEPSRPLPSTDAAPVPAPIPGPSPEWVWPPAPSTEHPPAPAVVPDAVPPEIPSEYRGRLIAEDFSGSPDGPFFHRDAMWLRNYTDLTDNDLNQILQTPMKMRLEDTDAPQVLIYHTHATESYSPYEGDYYDKRYNGRSTDNTTNMVAVGAVLADTLRSAGIGVIHDTDQHDYPSYTGSYQSSHDAIVRTLKKYPSIKVILDVHRDAIERAGGVIVKPLVEINGEKYAQVMIISNIDDGSGLIPNWRENLRFAAAFDNELQSRNKGISRPILFSPRKYNQQLSTGALLLEFGSHANTLAEAQRTAVLVGEALAQVLENTKNRT